MVEVSTALETIATDATRTGQIASSARPPSRPVAPVGVVGETLAAKTLLLYDGDWARFAAFCASIGAQVLPAAPETVVAFLQAETIGRAALARRLAAIDHRHRHYSLAGPGEDPQVRGALRAAKKAARRQPRPKPPSTAALHAMAGRCRRDLAGLRDRAVLLLLASGLSRGELVGLQVERLRWAEDGLRAEKQALWVLRGARHDLCPVRALEDWLRAATLRYGPVFRKVTRWGTVEPGGLGADAVRRILARHSP